MSDLAAPLTVEVATDEHALDALAPEWDDLIDRLDGTPFQRWAWHRAWWSHFAKPKQARLRIALFRQGGRLAGIVPFVAMRRDLFTELRTIGSRDRLTEQLDLIAEPDLRQPVLEALQDWLLAEPWSWVWLPQLRADDRLRDWFADRIADSTEIEFEHHVLPKSWNEMEYSLHKSMRSNTRYYPKLMRREGHPHSFEIASGREEITRALPLLWDLHTARAAAPTAIRHLDYLKPANRRAFLTEVATALAGREEAKIGLVSVDGGMAAAQMWLERAGVIYLYYSGFDPAWSRYSVAMICTSEIFQDAIRRGVQRVEFLRGANPWKTRWVTELRTEREVAIARRPRLAAARFAAMRQWREQRRRVARRLPWQVDLPE